MTLLGGGAAALFGELLNPLFLPAIITAHGTGYAPGGDIQRTPAAGNCRVQVDRCTETMKGADGYTATDQALYILAESLDGEVDTDMDVRVLEGPYAGSTYRTASPIDRDPGAAYWLARGVKQKNG